MTFLHALLTDEAFWVGVPVGILLHQIYWWWRIERIWRAR